MKGRLGKGMEWNGMEGVIRMLDKIDKIGYTVVSLRR